MQTVLGAVVLAGGADATSRARLPLGTEFEHWEKNDKIMEDIALPPGLLALRSDPRYAVYERSRPIATQKAIEKVFQNIDDFGRGYGKLMSAPTADEAAAARSGLGDTSKLPPQSPGTTAGGAAAAAAVGGLKPTSLEYLAVARFDAAHVSIALYVLVSKTITAAGLAAVSLPGPVKAIPRTTFKSAIKYQLNFARCNDMARMTIEVHDLPTALLVVQLLLGSRLIAVIQHKHRFAADYDVFSVGGYRDYQVRVSALFAMADAGSYRMHAMHTVVNVYDRRVGGRWI